LLRNVRFFQLRTINEFWSGQRRANAGRVATPLPEGFGEAGQEAVVQVLADFVRPG
jgi:hypothetical protein